MRKAGAVEITVRSSPLFRTLGLSQRSSTLFPFLQLTTPDLPAYPTSHPIPFYLHLLVLSPPALITSSPPQLRIPSPSSIQLTLDRLVLARAQGFQQISFQSGAGEGLSVVDLSKENRIWHGQTEYREQEEEGASDGGRAMVGRWGRGLTIVGEMRFEGTGVGPSFTRGAKDLLGCSVSSSFVSSPLSFPSFLFLT